MQICLLGGSDGVKGDGAEVLVVVLHQDEGALTPVQQLGPAARL